MFVKYTSYIQMSNISIFYHVSMYVDIMYLPLEYTRDCRRAEGLS